MIFNMILNIMGLLGVPKLPYMYILTKIRRGNANGNVHGNVPNLMCMCMGTWEHGGGKSIGNVNT
jgi:hypothetical protein